MTLAPNSTAARDVAYHLHPYTNVSQFEADGPLITGHAVIEGSVCMTPTAAATWRCTPTPMSASSKPTAR